MNNPIGVQLNQRVKIVDIARTTNDENGVISESAMHARILVNYYVDTSARNTPGKKYLPACVKAKVIKIKISNDSSGESKIQIQHPVQGRMTVDAEQVCVVYRPERMSDASDALTVSPYGTTLIPKNM
jgi:hypothetical protein